MTPRDERRRDVRVARNKGEHMKPGILLAGDGKRAAHGIPVDDQTRRELAAARARRRRRA
jgi:hypothetical protein